MNRSLRHRVKLIEALVNPKQPIPLVIACQNGAGDIDVVVFIGGDGPGGRRQLKGEEARRWYEAFLVSDDEAKIALFDPTCSNAWGPTGAELRELAVERAATGRRF